MRVRIHVVAERASQAGSRIAGGALGSAGRAVLGLAIDDVEICARIAERAESEVGAVLTVGGAGRADLLTTQKVACIAERADSSICCAGCAKLRALQTSLAVAQVEAVWTGEALGCARCCVEDALIASPWA